MAIAAVPAYTAVPPFPQLSERRLGTYNSKAYAFATHMSSVFMAELGALVTCAYENALWAQDRAAAAQAQAVIATAQADLAMGYRNTANNAASTATTKRDEAVNAASTATTKRDEAVNAAAAAVPAAATATQARADALAAAAAAQVFATQQLKATSASNLVPGAGPKTFMVEPGRSFVKGMYLVATSTGAAVNQMSGPVDSYDGATGALALLVDAFTGTAARADWVIGVAVPSSGGGLTRQVVNTNTPCVAGVAYIVAAAGIVLTLPAGWSEGDRIAIIEAIGNGAQYTVAFGTTPVRGRAVGSQVISAAFGGSGELTYQNSTQGLV